MVVICEECGKVYKLDSEKLKKSIKGKTSKIKCRVCEHVITISLDEEDQSAGNIQQVSFTEETEKNQIFTDDHDTTVTSEEETADNDETVSDDNTSDTVTEEPSGKVKKQKKTKPKKKSSGLGLRTKMFFLFLIIPISLMTISGVFSQFKMLELAANITNESTIVVKTLAEESIINKAKSVASQCSIFLSNNPDLNKDDFYYDLELKRISIQKVGLKGYTSLIEIPDPDEGDEEFIIWCHPNPDHIGVSILNTYKESLGGAYEHYRKLLNSLRKGKGSSGYHSWKDEKGVLKERFVAIEPIEQTKYIIMSTTNIEDFTQPIKDLQNEANKLTADTRNKNIVILVALLVIIGSSITIYGYKITNNIGKLTDAADRISVGELDVVIEVRSQDEIGALAEAISRMQDSLRFSIERLRRRR